MCFPWCSLKIDDTIGPSEFGPTDHENDHDSSRTRASSIASNVSNFSNVHTGDTKSFSKLQQLKEEFQTSNNKNINISETTKHKKSKITSQNIMNKNNNSNNNTNNINNINNNTTNNNGNSNINNSNQERKTSFGSIENHDTINISDISTDISDSVNIIAGRYELTELIGTGSFGNVYACNDLKITQSDKNQSIAMKILKHSGHHSFYRETMVLKYLQKCNIYNSIPKLYYFGQYKGLDIMVIQRLGTDLSTLFNFCDKKFTLPTVLKLTIQMIQHIENIHKNYVIHRDIKPHNFLIGYNKNKNIKNNQTYLIDFGLSKYYQQIKTPSKYNYNNNNTHIKEKEHIPKKTGLVPVGTARYASTWTHKGITQSRRDDLEALGFVWIYFLKGILPWQGIPLKNRKDKWSKIGKVKCDTNINDLCRGVPIQYNQYFKYVRNLKFDQKPDYQMLKDLFIDAAIRSNIDLDNVEWDWDKRGFEHP